MSYNPFEGRESYDRNCTHAHQHSLITEAIQRLGEETDIFSKGHSYPHVKKSLCYAVLSHVQLFATPWTVVCQAPLSTGFSKQEY